MNYLVIGAAGGVGLELVRKLLAEGHSVIGTVRDHLQAGQLRAALASVIDIEIVDLSDADAAADQMRRAALRPGLLHGVAVCAAAVQNKPLEVASLAELRRVLEVNAVAGLAIFQAAMPQLRKTKGNLVFMSSSAARVALPFMGTYAASKFALEGLVDVMRRETMGDGVKIAIVEPGGIRTPMLTKQILPQTEIDALPSELRLKYEALYERYYAFIAQSLEGACSEPSEIALIVYRALTDPDPEPRTIAGSDAQEMIAAIEAMGDRSADSYLHQIFFASHEGS